MILNSLRARNVLKYARLEIHDLPPRGLFAISGDNESGKTAVVETICLALFGRTFSLAPEEVTKSIRWGESESSVELGFTVRDGEDYLVNRSLGADGVHGAELIRVGEEQPVATGAAAVHAAVVELGGFNFQQYLDSLYLAQREISAPHSQSDTIKAVAGGVRLEEVGADLGAEVLEERRAIQALEAEVEGLREQIDALGICEDGISRLEHQQEALREEVATNEQEITGLQEASRVLTAACERLRAIGDQIAEADPARSLAHWREYVRRLREGLGEIEAVCETLTAPGIALCENPGLSELTQAIEGRLSGFDEIQERAAGLRLGLARELGESGAEPAAGEAPLPAQQRTVFRGLRRAGRWRMVARFNLLVMSILSLVAWGGWAALARAPYSEAAAIASARLGEYLPGWGDTLKAWLFPSAIVLSVVALLLLWRVVHWNRQVHAARERHVALGHQIEVAHHRAELIDYLESMSLPDALDSLHELEDPGLSEAVVGFADGPGRAFLEEEPLRELQDRVEEVVRGCEADLLEAREDLAGVVGGLEKENEQFRERSTRADEAIAGERERCQTARDLGSRIETLRARIPGHESRVRLLETARSLVRGTCQDLYSRFNRVLRRYTAEVMPRITHGRYRHMQIDDDLAVRVFSSEKNDFAELGELSSGTQRQIMLAVRLAMAKALTEAAVGGEQFLILDEPFAFFDRERIRSTLKALPEIDERLAQVWVIAQDFDDLSPFGLHLACDRGREELVVEGA